MSWKYLFIGLLLWNSINSMSAMGVCPQKYYVAMDGSNMNVGTSLTTPWQTLSYAVPHLRPGDTLFVRGGVYTESLLNTIPGGISWELPVTVAAYHGESVVVRPLSGSRVVYIEGTTKQYIILDGLIFDGTLIQYDVVKISYGAVSGAAHHIALKNVEVRFGPTQGVLVTTGSDDNIFSNMFVHDNGMTDLHHGFYISSSRNVLDHNIVSKNAGWGIHLYDGGAVKAVNQNTVINNIIQYNARVEQRGAGILLSSGSENSALANTVVENHGGIQIDYGSQDALVDANIVTMNKDYGITVGSRSTNTLIQNNMLIQNGPPELSDAGHETIFYQNTINGILQ